MSYTKDSIAALEDACHEVYKWLQEYGAEFTEVTVSKFGVKLREVIYESCDA